MYCVFVCGHFLLKVSKAVFCYTEYSVSKLFKKCRKQQGGRQLFSFQAKQHLFTVCVFRELSKNRIRRVEGLTFHGLHALRSLKMQRNSLSRLMDGAFWGLSNMEAL